MKSPYQRVPGRRWLVPGIVNQLWLGEDHILAIARTGYTESYQRFDLRDVQALISRRTRRRLWLGLGLGIPAGLMFLLGAALGGWGGVGASLFFAGPLLLAAAVNLLRGPTCISHLRTAVSVVELPSLARVRSFARAVRMLRPRLEAAQGSLAPEELEERLALLPQPATRPVPVSPAVVSARRATRVRPFRGAAHDVLFGLMIALGLLGLLRTTTSSTAVTAIGVVLILAVIVALVAAIIRQQDTDLAPPVRRVVWGAIAYLGSSFLLFYGFMMFEIVRHADKGSEPDAVFRFIVGGAESPAGLLSIAVSLAGIGIGIAGLLRLWSFRRARRSAAAHSAGPPASPRHP